MLKKEFVLCLGQEEKKKDISLVGKPNALKRKGEEKREDVAKLEGAWSLNWRSLILKACVMLMFLHFVENLQVSAFVCFIIYLVLKVYIFS